MEWILVKDRFPNNEEEIWVTVELGRQRFVFEMIYSDNEWCEWDCDYNNYVPIYSGYKIIAWAEKTEPKPYTG